MNTKTRHYFCIAIILLALLDGHSIKAQVSAADISLSAKTNAKANSLPQVKGGLIQLRKALDSTLGEGPCLHAKLQALMSIDETGQVVAVKLSRLNTELSFRDEEVRRYLRQNTVWQPAKYQNKVTAVRDFSVWIEDTAKTCLQEEKPLLEPALLQKKTSPAAIDGIYVITEEAPEFPGGIAAFMRYIQNRSKAIPSCANDTVAISVKIYLRFVIEIDGSVSNPEIIKAPFSCAAFEADVKRLLLSMPKWQAAKNNGTAVRSYFNLPIYMHAKK